MISRNTPFSSTATIKNKSIGLNLAVRVDRWKSPSAFLNGEFDEKNLNKINFDSW